MQLYKGMEIANALGYTLLSRRKTRYETMISVGSRKSDENTHNIHLHMYTSL